MASIAKDALAVRVLERLSVIAAGATPADADQALVEGYIDATHSGLRAPKNLVPFTLDDIPEWAQIPLCSIVAFNVTPEYGVTGLRKAELEKESKEGKLELSRQVAGRKHKRRVRQEYF